MVVPKPTCTLDSPGGFTAYTYDRAPTGGPRTLSPSSLLWMTLGSPGCLKNTDTRAGKVRTTGTGTRLVGVRRETVTFVFGALTIT